MTEPIRTSKQWADEIRADLISSVQSILRAGLNLTAAKLALPFGEFEKMIAQDLKMHPSVAQRLMKIAANETLTKAAQAQDLPASWTVLYELAQMPDAALQEAIKSGEINPQMTRNEARALRTVESTSRTVAPIIIDHDQQEAREEPEEEEESPTPTDHWHWSLSNHAGEAIAMPALWVKEFGEDWRSFEVRADALKLAQQAAFTWNKLATEMAARRKRQIADAEKAIKKAKRP